MENASFGFHKSWLILVLLLIGMGILFLSASAAMLYLQVHKDLKSIELPYLFYTNTLFLLYSSYIFHTIDVKRMIKSEILVKYRIIIFISFCFLIFQGIAWVQLISKNIFAGTERLAGFIYFFSILHFIHVLGGIPFLVKFFFNLRKNQEQQYLLVNQQRELNILKIYWHFLDLLWIYLVVFLSIFIYIL